MFNASNFTYDGVYSADYGLQIADLDGSQVINTTVFTPTLMTIKTNQSHRFFHNGILYENAPEHQFTVISEEPVTDLRRREILSWLVGRTAFKQLRIHQSDLEDYYYMCVFTAVDIIYINGCCHGFALTATFDSPYQYGEPTVVNITGTGTAQTITIDNRSDLRDGYVYPTIVFTASATSGGHNISIINTTDNASRAFVFDSLQNNETVTVDNEMKIITSSVAGEKLSNFNKNWLRLRKGINTLTVQINGTATITCPTYITIGF